MSTKDQLIQEIDQAPDFLLEEVLNFFLFLKLRLSERNNLNEFVSSPSAHSTPTFLQKAQKISQQLSEHHTEKLPADFAKNLDHYLYGAPKVEE
ncbi:hypothetical protein VB712_08095 [Spirulina sp. CCNP1310]|nr:hypothetical protein [Spirulina sp. CCNP1310]